MKSHALMHEAGLRVIQLDHTAVSLTCGRYLYLLSDPPDWWLHETIASMSLDASLILGVCLSSRAAATCDVALMVVEALRRAGHVSPPFSEDLRLTITELIANAHLHGNLEDVSPLEADDELYRRGISLSVARGVRKIVLTVANQSTRTWGGRRYAPIGRPVMPGTPVLGLGLKIVRDMGGEIDHTDDLSRWTVVFSIPAGHGSLADPHRIPE